jgi:hypothetical protein
MRMLTTSVLSFQKKESLLIGEARHDGVSALDTQSALSRTRVVDHNTLDVLDILD